MSDGVERFGLQPVEPIRMESVFAHQNRGDEPHVWGDIDMPVYPDETRVAGARLRETRCRLGGGLREACKRLGLSPVQLCAVERGAMSADVDAMIAALEDADPVDAHEEVLVDPIRVEPATPVPIDVTMTITYPVSAVNVCEHGDHPAPLGVRFCSPACATCEATDFDDTAEECAGLCRT